jgi:hypothetical protein
LCAGALGVLGAFANSAADDGGTIHVKDTPAFGDGDGWIIGIIAALCVIAVDVFGVKSWAALHQVCNRLLAAQFVFSNATGHDANREHGDDEFHKQPIPPLMNIHRYKLLFEYQSYCCLLSKEHATLFCQQY